MKQLLDKLGEVLFWKIAMKPGRPLAYGRIGGAHFFGLPGNPVAVMVTFYQFVRDALLVCKDERDCADADVQGALVAPDQKMPGRTEFQRGMLHAARGRLGRAADRRAGLGHSVVDVAGQLLHRAAYGQRQCAPGDSGRRAAARRVDLSEAPRAPTRAEAFRYWLRLGFISFGGPAGQIAIMHRELVDDRRWISERRFLHALNYCMVLPGPEAQQLATYIGWLHAPHLGRHRRRRAVRAAVARAS